MKRKGYHTDFNYSLDALKNNYDFQYIDNKFYYKYFSRFLLFLFVFIFFIINLLATYLNVTHKFMNLPVIYLSIPITFVLCFMFCLVVKTFIVIDCNSGKITDEIYLCDEMISQSVLIGVEDVLYVANNSKFVRGRHGGYFYYTLSFLKKDGKIADFFKFYDYKVAIDLVCVISYYWQRPMFIVDVKNGLVPVPTSNNSLSLKSVKIEGITREERIITLIIFLIFMILYILICFIKI